MDTPASDATRLIRPVLRSIVFCFSRFAQRPVKTLIFSCAHALILCVLLGSTAKLAHAAGNVAPVFVSCSNYLYQNAHSGYEQGGYTSAAAACGGNLGAYAGNGNYYCGDTTELRALCMAPVYSCPANSTGTSTCTCTDPYVSDTTQTSCILPACPDHASRTTPGAACTCDVNYKFDAAGTSCVPAATCPVDKLTTPPFDDACSTSLDQGKGVDVNNACGTLREPDMVEAASCIAAKIHAVNIPYTQPSATIRTAAYQNHLLEIWTKSQQLDTIMNSVVYTPETKQACVPRNVDVNNEKSQHGITHQPSSSGDSAPHVEQRAIDVPEAVSDALMDQVTTYTTTYTIVNGQRVPIQTIASDVEDYMHSAPNACNPYLSWGGRFDSHDWVHFELP